MMVMIINGIVQEPHLESDYAHGGRGCDLVRAVKYNAKALRGSCPSPIRPFCSVSGDAYVVPFWLSFFLGTIISYYPRRNYMGVSRYSVSRSDERHTNECCRQPLDSAASTMETSKLPKLPALCDPTSYLETQLNVILKRAVHYN